MRFPFTKMQGAGNDFVVLDETRGLLGLTPAHYRRLGDRHFGVGADQILSVRAAPTPDVDFAYVIHNADGAEVEQCGNGARCFARFVRTQGLSAREELRVQTRKGVITLRLGPDERVTVDMGAPEFAPQKVPFDAGGLALQRQGSWGNWPLPLGGAGSNATILVAILSMGNPHAVVQVADVQAVDVAGVGTCIQAQPRFSQGVNVGFMQVLARDRIRLRVCERGVGETLACGTGACAAVVAGMRLGVLDAAVTVHARGGDLHIAWSGAESAPVFMTGPAVTVFQGNIELPNQL